MSRTIILFVPLLACASTTSQRPAAVVALPARELALDTARSGMTKETYQSTIQVWTQLAQREMDKGRKLSPKAAATLAEMIAEELSYEKMTDLVADFYQRHFTEVELKELAAIQRSPTLQKLANLTPTMMAETGAQFQQIVQSESFQARVAARLGAEKPKAR
jgi:hypothetical protein